MPGGNPSDPGHGSGREEQPVQGLVMADDDLGHLGTHRGGRPAPTREALEKIVGR